MKTTAVASLVLRTSVVAALVALAGAAGCTSEVVDSSGDPEKGNGESALTGDPCEEGDSQDCKDDAGAQGVRYCAKDENGDLAWSACQVSSSASTPLVLVYGSERVEFSSANPGAFDLTAKGICVATDWPTAATPWLALDRNGNGRIDDGSELFGSASPLSTGLAAKHGFEPLAELDSDGDGKITPRDEAWSKLVLWSDRDGDRVSGAAELTPLAASAVTSIDVRHENARRCDERGNCEIERASFSYRTAGGQEQKGAVVDVHLKFQR